MKQIPYIFATRSESRAIKVIIDAVANQHDNSFY